MSTHKYKLMVIIKDNHGVSHTVNPIIEAESETEARRMAQAQYPDGNVRSCRKIN